MNLPRLQPRSRAALTPTSGGGRFPPPAAAAALGSGSRAPRPRRGFTPRSTSKTKPVGGGSGGQVKPKLTPQQQLEIIQRLETGNFKKGAGLSQFYEEFGSESSAKKMTCKQNLFSSFASVDPLASSTRNYGNGMAGSMESLISVGSSIMSSTTVVEGNDVTSLEVPMPGLILETEDYDSLPLYIKEFDRLLSMRENLWKRLEELAEVQCAAKFSQLLPQDKMLTFFKSLERVHKIIQKFLDGNASENMKMFMPPPKTKGPPPSVLHSDVESHAEIISAFYKLGEIMDKLTSIINREPGDFQLDARMESFKDLVGKLEEAIKVQEESSQGLKDMIKKTEILDLEENSVLHDSGTEAYEGSPSP